MNHGLSDMVRNLAIQEYIERGGAKQLVEISLGDMQRMLQKQGFPSGHLRQIRTSLESSLFWQSAGLKLVSPKGQPDRVGTVLVFGRDRDAPGNSVRPKNPETDPLMELSGVLRGAIQEGAAAFLRELRKDKAPSRARRSDEENAA